MGWTTQECWTSGHNFLHMIQSTSIGLEAGQASKRSSISLLNATCKILRFDVILMAD